MLRAYRVPSPGFRARRSRSLKRTSRRNEPPPGRSCDLGGTGATSGSHEPPTIIIEFVSKGKINQDRDYIAKRAEYREIGVKEYWIIDRFAKTLTVYRFTAERDEELVITADQIYTTPCCRATNSPSAVRWNLPSAG